MHACEEIAIGATLSMCDCPRICMSIPRCQPCEHRHKIHVLCTCHGRHRGHLYRHNGISHKEAAAPNCYKPATYTRGQPTVTKITVLCYTAQSAITHRWFTSFMGSSCPEPTSRVKPIPYEDEPCVRMSIPQGQPRKHQHSILVLRARHGRHRRHPYRYHGEIAYT